MSQWGGVIKVGGYWAGWFGREDGHVLQARGGNGGGRCQTVAERASTLKIVGHQEAIMTCSSPKAEKEGDTRSV